MLVLVCVGCVVVLRVLCVGCVGCALCCVFSLVLSGEAEGRAGHVDPAEDPGAVGHRVVTVSLWKTSRFYQDHDNH